MSVQKRTLTATEHYVIMQVQSAHMDYPIPEISDKLDVAENTAKTLGVLGYSICNEKEFKQSSKRHTLLPEYLHQYLSLGFDESCTTAFLAIDERLRQYCNIEGMGLVVAVRESVMDMCYLGLQFQKNYNGLTFIGNQKIGIKIIHPELVKRLKNCESLVLCTLNEGEITHYGREIFLTDVTNTAEARYNQSAQKQSWHKERGGDAKLSPSLSRQTFKKPKFGK